MFEKLAQIRNRSHDLWCEHLLRNVMRKISHILNSQESEFDTMKAFLKKTTKVMKNDKKLRIQNI